MSCTPTAFAFNKSCTPSQGGIAAVYVADPDKITPTFNNGAGTVSLAPNPAGSKPLYKWDVADNSGSLESTAQISKANNTKYFQHILTVGLNGFGPKTAGVELFSKLSRLAFVVEYRDGTRVFMAWSGINRDSAFLDGAELTALVISPGTQRDDRNGATVTAQLDSLYTLFVVSNDISAMINS